MGIYESTNADFSSHVWLQYQIVPFCKKAILLIVLLISTSSLLFFGGMWQYQSFHYHYLVRGDWNMLYEFPFSWDFPSIPTDELTPSFFRGVGIPTTNQLLLSLIYRWFSQLEPSWDDDCKWLIHMISWGWLNGSTTHHLICLYPHLSWLDRTFCL